MSMLVHLPPHVRENMERELQVDQQIELARYWTKVLRAQNPRLSVVWAKPSARSPLVPERWHVKRRNDGDAPDSYMPIVTDDGGYREPAHDILDMLGKRDLWRTVGGLAAHMKALEADRAKGEEAAEKARKDRVEESADVIRTLGRKSMVVRKDLK